MQDNARMNKPTLQDVLTALCLSAPHLLKKDGSINHNELARLASLNQPTVTRILNGESKEPKRGNLAKLATVFAIKVDQLEGLEKIDGLFEDDHYEYQSSSDTKQSISKGLGVAEGILGYRTDVSRLSEDDRQDVLATIREQLSPAGKLRFAQLLLSDLEDVL